MARYVIDYYGIKQPRRETKFVIDARPAFDSLDNVRMRVVALVGRIFSILGVAATSVRYKIGAPLIIKGGMCLLAVWISVYLSRSVLVL